jgi:hypothetical protein
VETQKKILKQKSRMRGGEGRALSRPPHTTILGILFDIT